METERYDVMAFAGEPIASLQDDDDPSVVLRAHVHFERHLDNLLLAEIPNCDPFLDALMFVAKLKLTRTLNLTEGQTVLSRARGVQSTAQCFRPRA